MWFHRLPEKNELGKGVGWGVSISVTVGAWLDIHHSRGLRVGSAVSVRNGGRSCPEICRKKWVFGKKPDSMISRFVEVEYSLLHGREGHFKEVIT